jgi:transposase
LDDAVPTETVTYTRRTAKNRGDAVHDSGLRFDATVPVQVIQQPAPELQGPEAEAFAVIGEKITHRLAQRPGAYVILEYHRPVLKRRDTEQVITTPAPPNVLERSLADVSFLAGMLIDKFLYHLPLYRQHQRLLQSGIQLSRMTLGTLAARAPNGASVGELSGEPQSGRAASTKTLRFPSGGVSVSRIRSPSSAFRPSLRGQLPPSKTARMRSRACATASSDTTGCRTSSARVPKPGCREKEYPKGASGALRRLLKGKCLFIRSNGLFRGSGVRGPPVSVT